MELFERFKDTHEEGFRNDFIKPLLVRMGFFEISNQHGSQEFGKDFVFSEFDRFFSVRHMVAQAKHEQRINQGVKVDNLISQIKQAFHVPYRLPSALADERYVSAVYVFNTGEVTENAKTQIVHGLPRELASNTHVYGGEQLELLSHAIAQSKFEEVPIRLNALIQQTTINIDYWQRVRDGMHPDLETPTYQMRGAILHGLEEFLSRPVLQDSILLEAVGYLWQLANAIDNMLARQYLRTFAQPEKERVERQMIVDTCNNAIQSGGTILVRSRLLLQNLPTQTI